MKTARLVVPVAIVAAIASCAFADTTVVGANETIVVTDDNAATYADGFSFTDNTGVIEFETTAAPTMDITGSGTVKKTYDGDWTMATPISNFTGTYDLCGEGVVSFSSAYVFGSGQLSSYKLYVRNGATIRFTSNTARLESRTLHVEGYGATGANAAIEVDAGVMETNGGTIRNIFLEDDATIYMAKDANLFFNYGKFNFNGHRLIFTGRGVFSTTASQILKGGGELVTTSEGSAVPTYCYRIAKVDEDSPIRFVFNGKTKIQISDKSQKPNATMWIAGTNTFQVVDYWNSSWWDWTTNSIGWGGPIVFTNETGMSHMTLDMAGDYTPQHQINFMGPISGNGRLTMSPGYLNSRVLFGATNNTFTGGFYWNGNSKNNARLLLLHPGSLPDSSGYSSITCNYGHIDCVFDSADTDAPWDFAHFKKLANGAFWKSSSFAAMVGPGGEGDFGPVQFGAGITNPIGANAVATLTGSEDGAFSNLTWRCGTARIVGPGKHNVGVLTLPNGLTQIGTNTYSSVMELDGGVEFVTASNATHIGYGDAADASQIARLVVKNAFLHGPDDQPKLFSKGHQYALAVGCNGNKVGGILEVCDGAVVSNKLLVSGWGDSAGEGSGRGMVIQRGGTVYSLGVTDKPYFGPGLGLGGSGHGTYIMHAGKFTALGSFTIGGYGMGNWVQYGGTAVFTNYPGSTFANFSASTMNGGYGEIYLAKGTMSFFSSFILSGSNQAQHSKFVIDGPDAFLDLHNKRLRANENHVNHLAQLTVRNGGTIRTSGTKRNLANTVYTITFDGGILKCGSKGQEMFCYVDSGSPDYANQTPDLVAVFPGGMTVDTDGNENNYTGVPIKGATGGGISQVPFDGPISGSDGFVQPYVDICGDGLGATAVALFDTSSYAVTGIVVTCPGVEYTTATALVYVSTKTIKKTIVLDDYIVQNVNCGGFTKTGSQTFTLKATNTWGGATTAAGGTLKAGVDWAIPAGTDVYLRNGGELNFNGRTGEVASVTYCAGGGSITEASNVKFATDAMNFTISAEELIAGQIIPWNGDLDFSKVTLTVTGDLSALADANTKYNVVTVSGGAATGAPTLISGELPKSWEYRISAHGVKLMKIKGSVMLVR